MGGWVDILKIGAEIHRDGRVITISHEFAAQMVQNFTRMRVEGHEVVVLKEHQREGVVYGTVPALRVWDGYIQAKLSFLRDDERDLFQAGMIRRFSPGFALQIEHPHTGEVWGPTLLEVSFTSMPYQQNLRPPVATTPGVRLAFSFAGEIVTDEEFMEDEEKEAPEGEATAPAEEEEELTLSAAFLALSEKLDAIMARFASDDEPDEEEMSAREEVERLSAENAELRDTVARMELSAAGIEENEEVLVALKRDNAEAFGVVLEMARPKPREVQESIGRVGEAETTATTTADDIIKLAAESGKTYGSGLVAWCASNYPDHVADVVASAKQRGNA